MNFNYTVSSIKVKSSWFDRLERKKSVFQKITYKGLNLYFQLFKFRLYNQDNEYTFITSISMLRKETGYSTQELFDLLKKLKSTGVIKIDNVSRWDYLIDENGEIKDKDILVIIATDLPKTERKQRVYNGEKVLDKQGNPVYYDSPIDEDNYYIGVSFAMLELYKRKGLNERFYALYCLIMKWRNGYQDERFNMSIEKIADTLGYDKDSVNRMIYQMNRNYLLSSYRERRKGRDGFKYNHYLLTSADEEKMDKWIQNEKPNMDKLIKRVDKKKNSKKSMSIEDDLETVEVEESEDKLAWGERKAQVIGQPDPFEDDLSWLDDLDN